jgi:integrase
MAYRRGHEPDERLKAWRDCRVIERTRKSKAAGKTTTGEVSATNAMYALSAMVQHFGVMPEEMEPEAAETYCAERGVKSLDAYRAAFRSYLSWFHFEQFPPNNDGMPRDYKEPESFVIWRNQMKAEHKSPLTIDQYVGHVARFLTFKGGDPLTMAKADVTRFIADGRDRMEAIGRSGFSASHTKCIYSAIRHYALSNDVDDPTAGLKRPGRANDDVDAPLPEDVEILLAGCHELEEAAREILANKAASDKQIKAASKMLAKSKRMRAVTILGAGNGFRLGESKQFKPDWLKQDRRSPGMYRIRFPGQRSATPAKGRQGKAEGDQIVASDAVVYEFLHSGRWERHERVIPERQKNTIGAEFANFARSLGVDITSHALRAFYATELDVASDGDRSWVQMQLRHRSSQATDRYVAKRETPARVASATSFNAALFATADQIGAPLRHKDLTSTRRYA